MNPHLTSNLRSALDEQPSPGAVPRFHPSPVTISSLCTGLPAWFARPSRLPVFSLRIVIDGGSTEDPAGEEGLVALADGQITRGANGRDALTVAELLDRAALRLSVATSARGTTISLDGHAERLELGITLLAEALMTPTFDEAELERARALRLGDLVQDLDNAEQLARNGSWRALFGDGHPLAHPPSGTRAGVSAARNADARRSWEDRRASRAANLVFCGQNDPDEVRGLLETHLAGWRAADRQRRALPGPSTTEVRRIFIDKPGSTQSVLSVLAPAPGARDPMLHAARVATIGLGGTFTSRLNHKLREEKGYTYGVSCQLQPAPDQSVVAIRTAVHGAATADALTDLLAELRRIREGLTPDEIGRAALARRTQLVAALETSSNVADAYASLWECGRPSTGFVDELDVISSLGAADVQAGAEHLGFEQAALVVVADLAQVRASVEGQIGGTWEVWPATT